MTDQKVISVCLSIQLPCLPVPLLVGSVEGDAAVADAPEPVNGRGEGPPVNVGQLLVERHQPAVVHLGYEGEREKRGRIFVHGNIQNDGEEAVTRNVVPTLNE